MKLLHLCHAEALLHLHRQRRYALEFVASSLIVLAAFAVLAYGIELLSTADFIPTQSSLALGFVLWSFASAAYSGIAGETADEVRGRTLEQLCVIASPLPAVLMVRCGLQIIGALLGTLVLLHVTFWIVGRDVDVPVGSLIIILLAAAPSLVGLGLIMGGLSVLFKQAEAVNAVILLGVVALVSTPAYPANVLAVLPFSHAAAWIIAEQSALSLSGQWLRLLLVAGNGLSYLAAGIAAFDVCFRAARRRGTLGHT